MHVLLSLHLLLHSSDCLPQTVLQVVEEHLSEHSLDVFWQLA